MSQIDFCKSVGIGRATLTDLLAALNDNFEKANVTLESLCKIADYLGIPLFFLFMGRDDWTRIREALRWYDGVGANEEYLGQSKHGEPTTSQSENRKRDELLDLVCKMQGVSVEERARWASTAIQLIEGSFLTKEQTNVEGAEVRAAPRWRTHTDEPVVPKEERRRQKALMALAPLDSAAGEAKKEAPEILRLMTIAVIAGKREQMLQSRFTNGSKE
jgi:transcriptional regulator with XRE-family HTH domain